jgi:mono/diheme cytochrome c family protein
MDTPAWFFMESGRTVRVSVLIDTMKDVLFKNRWFLRRAAIGFVGWCALGSQAMPVRAADLSGAAQFHKDIEPILHEYCFDCHGDGEKKGGVSFDEFASDEALVANRDLWWNALKYLRAGAMPPQKKPRPTTEEQQRIAAWIKEAVFNIDPANLDPGRVTLRRLNRVEYHNTIQDLLGVDFNTQVEFPPDDTGYGFDDIGDVLTLSPMLLEKYVAAAHTIITRAVPTVPNMPAETTVSGAQFIDVTTNASNRHPQNRDFDLAFDKPARLLRSFNLKYGGSYQLSLDVSVRGTTEFDPRKCRLVLKMDDHELANKEFGWVNTKTYSFDFDQQLPAGEHHFTIELQPLNPDAPGTNALSMRPVAATLRGPMEKKYWIKNKSYDRFFAGEIPKDSAGRRKYAQENLRAFATKAFRTPVDDRTVDRLTSLAEETYSQPGKTVEQGIAQAMQAVIASPRFLFHLENGVPKGSTGGFSDVGEYALASRLSYFLWSTMPDEELLRLAEKGELRKNLAAQVQRMMQDPRSAELVRNFTGQWLQARDVQNIAIDTRAVLSRDNARDLAFPRPKETNAVAEATGSDAPRPQRRFQEDKPPFKFDADLRQLMRNETEMFFTSVVKDDLDVATLIDSDYTFLNEKLAQIYGLSRLNVRGSEMRRVELPADCPRGGVITEGTVLVVTSNPDRTSPVKRGVFVLNNILGMPPPPPPPNVPALEASDKNSAHRGATLRELLEAHRSQPLCASCHARMDPIGLALENFNALGMWRDTERNQEIKTGGKLMTEESFDNVQQLKRILATKHREDFYRCLTEKLLTYALGRGLEYYDVDTVDRIVQRLEQNNGRFSALLMGVIESAPFQRQRNEANPDFAYSNEDLKKSGSESAKSN